MNTKRRGSESLIHELEMMERKQVLQMARSVMWLLQREERLADKGQGDRRNEKGGRGQVVTIEDHLCRYWNHKELGQGLRWTRLPSIRN